MATIRLVPSTYATSGTNYLTVADEDNMYTNTDSNTYATITNINASTSSRYLYLRGFNFDDIPSDAIINSFTIKIKGYETSLSTSTSYAPRLANGTSALSNTTASENFEESTKTITIPTGALTWQQITNYGSTFTIMVYVRRSNRNTTGYLYCYGAEIEVNYTIPNPRTVTTTLTGNGTIDPSGTQTMYDGDDYDLIIEPTDSSDEVSATKNGTAITLTKHTGGPSTESKVLGSYTLVSGSFNGSGATYFSGIVGHGHDASQTTSNYYSSGNGTIAVFTYDVPFEDIPDKATITSLYMMVNGHAESTSQSSEYMCVRLISGSTNLSDELNFKSVGTSNSTQTVTANVTPTIAQLENLKVQCRLGYYGGAINGATVYLTYEVSGVYYTYSTTISGNMTIAVTIGSVAPVSVTGVSLDKATASLEIGDTLQLVETVVPSNATNKSVTWSTSSSSIATVTNGLVTAVASGTARITVTTADGGFTAYCDVTVAAAVTYEYILTDTMVPGKTYLIANGNSGTVQLLSNTSGGSRILVGVTATVVNNKITITKQVQDSTEFECVRYTAGNDVTITVKKDNQYLYSDNSSGLRMNAPTTLDRFWHYKDNKFWQFKSTTSDGYDDTSTEYKYYLQMSGNNFTDNHVTSPSIEESDIPAIYIFRLYDASDALYFKENGTWKAVTKAYKKVNGSWVEQLDLTTVFDQTKNYVKG